MHSVLTIVYSTTCHLLSPAANGHVFTNHVWLLSTFLFSTGWAAIQCKGQGCNWQPPLNKSARLGGRPTPPPVPSRYSNLTNAPMCVLESELSIENSIPDPSDRAACVHISSFSAASVIVLHKLAALTIRPYTHLHTYTHSPCCR